MTYPFCNTGNITFPYSITEIRYKADKTDTAALATPVLKSVSISSGNQNLTYDTNANDIEITQFHNGLILDSIMPYTQKSEQYYFSLEPEYRKIKEIARQAIRGIPDEESQVLNLRNRVYMLAPHEMEPSYLRNLGIIGLFPITETTPFLHKYDSLS